MPVDIKRIIAKNLLEMLKKKRLEKITIRELVDVCGISRQTFYYHFKDVIDVIEWWAQESYKRLLSDSLKAKNAREALTVFLDFVIQYSETIQNLLESRWRVQIETLVVNAVSIYLKDMLQYTQPNTAISPADLETFLRFYSYGITGMIFEFALKGTVDKETLVDQLCQVLFQKSWGNTIVFKI